MAIALYLAQTAAEFASSLPKPEHIAWMACHFSPYGTGITNLPKALPEGSLLILNDRTPVSGHDPNTVCSMLLDAQQRLRCGGIVLDLQRRNCEETAAIAAKVSTLPCPVAVSQWYAKDLSCAVFLSSVPLHKPLAEYLSPWSGRDIWLEAATGCTQITVTETGSHFSQLLDLPDGPFPFCDRALHCRYRTQVENDSIQFTLYRGKEELNDLLEDAQGFGITRAVGLYQELG